MAKLVAADVRLRGYSQELQRAESLWQCWDLTVEALRDLGFDHVAMELPPANGHPRLHREETLHPERGEIRPNDCWSLRIHFSSSEEGFIALSRRLDRGEGYLIVHPIVEAIRQAFPNHIAAYQEQRLSTLTPESPDKKAQTARAAAHASGAGA